MKPVKNESAVSEVISVVLVVALTVILAALVAAYMFGMIPTLPQQRTIALTAGQLDDNTIIVVYHGGPDHASLNALNISWPSGARQQVISPKIGQTFRAVNTLPVSTPRNVTGGKDRIVITGIFANNVQQVVLDTYV